MKTQQRTHKADSHLTDAFHLAKVKTNTISILKQNFTTKSQHIISILQVLFSTVIHQSFQHYSSLALIF